MKTEPQKKKTHFEADTNQKTPTKTFEPPILPSKTTTEADPKDIAAANYLDVAVLRCLFISNWQEDGVYWGLHYMYNRLREIGDEAKITSRTRKNRSNSLPIPQIEISKVTNFGRNKTDSPPSTTSSSNELSSEHQSSLHATGELYSLDVANVKHNLLASTGLFGILLRKQGQLDRGLHRLYTVGSLKFNVIFPEHNDSSVC